MTKHDIFKVQILSSIVIIHCIMDIHKQYLSSHCVPVTYFVLNAITSETEPFAVAFNFLS